MPTIVQGSLRSLYLYDVSQEIRLDEVRKLIGVRPPRREPSFRAPEYVRLEPPPVIVNVEAVRLEGGELLQCRMQFYDYGVVSVEFELGFEFE